MSCEEVLKVLDGYLDGELNSIRTTELERHLAECNRCRLLREQQQELRETMKAHATYFDASKGFERRIRAQLRDARGPKASPTIWKPFTVGWRFSAVLASMLVLIISTAMFIEVLRRPSPAEMLTQEVVSSHIRSLMGNHLMDIPSLDQHTVKPWFSGKLDFAPIVKDLAPKGFPLTGGRLDYLDGRPVAALLYKRRQHIINLFVWPSSKSNSTAQTVGIRGYSIVHWTQSGMTYWAVSDLNAPELMEFVHALQQ